MFNLTVYDDFVSNNVLKDLNDVYVESLNYSYIEDNSLLYTVDGTQTKNIISKLSIQSLNEIYFHVNSYIQKYYKYNENDDNMLLDYYNFFIDHMHIINYDVNGYQKIHTHHHIEDHSFIICLNDSDGKTRMYLGKDPIDLNCIKNKIYIFNAALFHEGLRCTIPRRIAVGSVRFNYKVWKQRN